MFADRTEYDESGVAMSGGRKDEPPAKTHRPHGPLSSRKAESRSYPADFFSRSETLAASFSNFSARPDIFSSNLEENMPDR